LGREYDGWGPLDAWRRTTEVARQAERLGFESIWIFDHFHTVPRPTDAINVPKPIQRPRVPMMVGGTGPNVTWRLAARHADELNLDGLSPAEVAEALPVIRSRCGAVAGA